MPDHGSGEVLQCAKSSISHSRTFRPVSSRSPSSSPWPWTRRPGPSARATSRSPKRSSKSDAVIDEKAIALDELAIEILARQQPVARDLRIVVSALRISASLERMGDIAEHIAQLTRMRFPERAIPKGLKGTFTKMGELDVDVARQLTELLRTQDLALSDEIRNNDDLIDDLHVSVFEKVLSDTWQGEASATVDATLASRYHERFADHAVSVAKKVAYLATGDWTTETDTLDIVSTP